MVHILLTLLVIFCASSACYHALRNTDLTAKNKALEESLASRTRLMHRYQHRWEEEAKSHAAHHHPIGETQ